MTAVKTLGPSYTITHVGHAAMIVAMLKHQNPQGNEAQAILRPIVSSCFINGRRYLKGDGPKGRTYLPNCQATGIVEFPDVREYTYVTSGGDEECNKEKAKKALIKACKAANRSYQKIRERESIFFGVIAESRVDTEVSGRLSERKSQRKLRKNRYISRKHEEIADPVRTPYFLLLPAMMKGS